MVPRTLAQQTFLRTGNKLAAVLTLLGDAAKGWVAVTIARAVLGDPASESNNLLLGLVTIAVFLGHLSPHLSWL